MAVTIKKTLRKVYRATTRTPRTIADIAQRSGVTKDQAFNALLMLHDAGLTETVKRGQQDFRHRRTLQSCQQKGRPA